jgi:flagellar basal-body rod protein FlgC
MDNLSRLPGGAKLVDDVVLRINRAAEDADCSGGLMGDEKNPRGHSPNSEEASMSVFDTIRIAASGLTAQRLRMDVAASNLANAQTTRTAGGQIGEPYQAEAVVFQAQQMGPMSADQGVSAVAIVRPNRANTRVYDPNNPDADANGFVNYPNVDVASEMTDMMGAARSYQVNATVAQAAKQQALDALDLGRG